MHGSIAWILFFTVFVSYAYFYQGAGHNEAARLDAIRAFSDSGSLIIDPFVYNSADVIMKDGHYYSGKAPGTFFLGLAPFAVTERVLRLLGVQEDFRYHWACYFANTCSNSLLGAVTVVLMFLMGLRLGVAEKDAAAAALSIGFGTMMFPFSTVFFSHVATAFFLFFAFYQLFAVKQERLGRQEWRIWCAGLALGFSVTLEYPAVIGVGLIGLYALSVFWVTKEKFKTLVLKLVVAVILGFLPLIIYNLAAFKAPFYITYEAYSQSADTAFTAHKQGVLGIRVPLWDWEAWPQFWSNLTEITIQPLRGLFFNNPVLLMVFFGLANFTRRRSNFRASGDAEMILATLVFLAFLTFNACFGDSIVYWGGGASFGPRYMIVALPFLALPLMACLSHRFLRVTFIGLALISAFFCLMAASIEPRAPYWPPNPILEFYLPRFSRGVFADGVAGIFSSRPIVEGAVAFNLGKLAGLRGWAELLPLYFFWIFMMWRLDRLTKQKGILGYALVAVVFAGAAMAMPAVHPSFWIFSGFKLF